jgi:exopolyphosphatase / guanosine-5'-triphosphate,3'-diphosphate pyrophosphatase
MRVAVVDVGTNSTRLLIAEVEAGSIREIERRTRVTRLGEGVDANGRLSDEAIQRVVETCADYREEIDRNSPERTVAVLTSAVRDADNGEEFERLLHERFGFDAATIPGEREARLTFIGAVTGRDHSNPLLVLDIGGGSTEFVVGSGENVAFHVSTQVGAVRHSERFLRSDPPTEDELVRAEAEIRGEILAAVPAEVRRAVVDGVAVAGTPTSFAAIDQRLVPYDPARVEGYRLSLARAKQILAELAALPLESRRGVPGLEPERAPTIVAGGLVLVEAMKAFGLDPIEISEHDLLHGMALEAAV